MNYEPKIKKEQLVHGQYYAGRCRNAEIARWDGKYQVFRHWRTKFGQTFLEEIRCPEDEQHFDVFVTTAVFDGLCKEIPLPEEAL